MLDWNDVCRNISTASGADFQSGSVTPVGGGCINATHVIRAGARRYFVKSNSGERLGMFQAEAAGLAELARAGAIRVPAPVCSGRSRDTAYLVLEYVPLGRGNHATWRTLGTQLARQHRVLGDRFGWTRDNTLGSTPQLNRPDEDWARFFARERLGRQLQLAAHNGYRGALLARGERLLDSVGALLTSHVALPSLLHGDLWTGNVAGDARGEPVVFDPAVYYGDRETDLAMTELFGRLDPEFYAAYRAAWPIDAGYGVRRTLYNLYHILNHLNLFGRGYAAQAQHMIDQLLSELS